MNQNGQFPPSQGSYFPCYPTSAYPQLSAAYCMDGETIRAMQCENDQLRYQLAQKVLREDALKRAYQLQGNRYFSQVSSGRLVEITDFVFEHVAYFHFEKEFRQEPLIQVTISGKKNAYFTESEFLNDKKFFNLLQMRTGGKITPFGSVAQAITLLRSIACEQMVQTFVPYFAGWNQTKGHWQFHTFSNFKTCAKSPIPILHPSCLPPVSLVAAKISGEQLLKDFEAIGDSSLRETLLLCMHVAFLQTLIESFGVHTGLALHLPVYNVAAQEYLEKLLRFGNDTVISLGSDMDAFKSELISRKDRTAVIREGYYGENTLQNIRILRSALNTGKVKLASGKHDPVATEIYSFAIILGAESSLLGFQPEIIPLQADSAAFDQQSCMNFLENGLFRAEYWAAFAGYAEQEISHLQKIIQESILSAKPTADMHNLDVNSSDLLGIMRGVKGFLVQFHTYVGIPSGSTDDWEEGFLCALEMGCSPHESLDGLSEIFVAVARQMIKDRRLCMCPNGHCPTQEKAEGTVYFDQNTFSLDHNAFNSVCKEAQCNPTAVKRDLREKGFLLGKPVNTLSYTTRILCCNAYGQHQQISAYKFGRYSFEKIGEPALI